MYTMKTYSRLWARVIGSSEWATLGVKERVLWVTMLGIRDMQDTVHASVEALAGFARLPLADVKEILHEWENGQPKRIATVDDGWVLANMASISRVQNGEERQIYNRIAQREHREGVRMKRAYTRRAAGGNGQAAKPAAEAPRMAQVTPEQAAAAVIVYDPADAPAVNVGVPDPIPKVAPPETIFLEQVPGKTGNILNLERQIAEITSKGQILSFRDQGKLNILKATLAQIKGGR